MVTWDDFDKIWARTSPLTPYEFSDPNYSQGWNFVGSTPPARQMWDSIQKKNDEKFKYLRDNFGTPNIVTSSSQMTDTDKVYVYIGSEAGWNNGHWYYWDGSAWADGGVYNATAFVTDTTLSIAGQPADAKATGDALALKADLAGCTFTGNVNVTADLSVTGTSTLAGDVTASSDLSVAGDSSLTNLSVSGTTALAGTSTAPTPSADDNSTKIATTEYVQTEIKPIETDVDIAQKDIANIKALLQGNLYDYQTDSTSAYTKSVPSGAMPYAGLEQIGGKTIVYNQLINPASLSATTTKYGVTYTPNSNGSVSFSGEATGGGYFDIFRLPVITGHKYYANGLPLSSNVGVFEGYYVQNTGYTNSFLSESDFVFAFTGGTSFLYFGRAVKSGTTYNETVYPQFIDLTLAFGSGNEPTLEQCKAMFPAETYPFSAGTLLSAGVTQVESSTRNLWTLGDKTVTLRGDFPLSVNKTGTYQLSAVITPASGNTNTSFLVIVSATGESLQYKTVTLDSGRVVFADIALTSGKEYTFMLYAGSDSGTASGKTATYSDIQLEFGTSATAYIEPFVTTPIPAEVQALEGYGWSAGTVYNYVDFERKVLVKNVDKVDLGSLSWIYSGGGRFYCANLSTDFYHYASSAKADMICVPYITDTTDNVYAETTNKTIAVIYSGGINYMNVYDTSYSDAPTLKSFLNGKYAYIRLATPQEIDISQYLTDDNLINVEAGGTLTFPNQHGDDYRLPVPSEETYMIDLQSALGE